jgi:hypothetical protein
MADPVSERYKRASIFQRPAETPTGQTDPLMAMLAKLKGYMMQQTAAQAAAGSTGSAPDGMAPGAPTTTPMTANSPAGGYNPAPAAPSVTVQAPPYTQPFKGLHNAPYGQNLPPFEQPGAMSQNYMPGHLPQASAEVVQNTTPAPAAPPQVPGQPQVPPMPDPVQIGASDGSVRGDILAAIEAKKRAAMVPPWAVNQGTLADQQG